MQHELVSSIASYGDRYRTQYLAILDPHLLLTDWWAALDFFFGRACYQGRKDAVSAQVQLAIREVLNPRFGQEDGVRNFEREKTEHWMDIKANLKARIGKGRVGKARDIEMVTSTLDFIAKLPDLNIVRYSRDRINRKEIGAHYKELQRSCDPNGIIQVGPKIASFYLRDIVVLFDLEPLVPIDVAFQLQPIDVWVRRLVIKLRLVEPDASDDHIREAIVAECLHQGISPIRFNQGAWYVGFHAFDLFLELLSRKSVDQ